MRKYLNIVLALVITAATLTYSRPGQAAIGGLLLSAPVAIAGLAITGGGYYWLKNPSSSSGDIGSLGEAILAAGIVMVGLIVLEGENEITFQSLSANEAKKIGLSQTELSHFNADIDQVNAVVEMVSEELSQINQATPADSAKVWENAKAYLAPETFSAMVKISSQLTK